MTVDYIYLICHFTLLTQTFMIVSRIKLKPKMTWIAQGNNPCSLHLHAKSDLGEYLLHYYLVP